MWITNENFETFKQMVSVGQSRLLPMDDIELKVAADTLDSKQMKELSELDSDKFVVYANKKRKPRNIKYEFIKESYYDDTDIIPIIKRVISDKDRIGVMRILDDYNPVVLQIWLLQPCLSHPDAWATYVLAEKYVYEPMMYYTIISDPSLLNATFKFPKKLRSE